MKDSKFLRALNRHPNTTPPVWFMRQAGRYLPEYQKIRKNYSNFLDMCKQPNTCAELALQPIDRFGLDASILFSDILTCLLYTSPSPRDRTRSRMPSSA